MKPETLEDLGGRVDKGRKNRRDADALSCAIHKLAGRDTAIVSIKRQATEVTMLIGNDVVELPIEVFWDLTRALLDCMKSRRDVLDTAFEAM